MSDDCERLAELHAMLGPRDRAALVAFAEFLVARGRTAAPAPVVVLRPERETALQAVRRLNRSYPMLDRARLLGPVGELLSRHLLEGDDPSRVIDALEALYAAERDRLAADRGA